MTTSDVLILDGHCRAALESLQALGRAGLAVDIAAASADALSFCSRYARRRLIQPPTLPVAPFLAWLRAQDAADTRLIVPATEASLLALRALPEDDPLRRKAVIPGDAALDAALDKEATRALARRLGIPVPEGRLIQHETEIDPPPPQFPVVLKPVRSKIEVGGELETLPAVVVWDEAVRRARLALWLPHTAVQQQDFVLGSGVGIELLYHRGRAAWRFAHQRLHELPLTGGASTYRQAIEPPPALLAAAERLLDALDWHGVAMVEFRRAPDGSFHLIEINPRLWGSLALSIDAGVNFPLGLWRLAGCEPPGPQPPCRIGFTTRIMDEDLAWMKANLKAGRGNPLLLTRPPLRSALEWLRPLTGRESWDHFDWRDLGVTAAVLRGLLARLFHSIH